MAKKNANQNEEKPVEAPKSPSKKAIEVPIDIFLKMEGVKEWNKGGMIAFAEKKAKKKQQTAEEWKELFKNY